MKTITQQLNVKDFPFIIKDKNGNEIYYEDSHGFWHKRECDSNGKVIYSEDSNGWWYKNEYGSNGNKIYYENSTGYWEKVNTIPMEIKSTGKTLMGKLETTDLKVVKVQ